MLQDRLLYTLTDKTDIAQDSAIKSVQSKQIMVDSFDTFTKLMGIVVQNNLSVITGLPADQRRIF